MTTKELIEKHGGWDCRNDEGKRFIAVPYDAGKENAKRIANYFFKVNKSRLRCDYGCINDGEIYRNGTVGADIWIVWTN